MALKNVFEVTKEYGSKLDEFRSALSRDWETVLFKAIDMLHQLDREKLIDGRDIVNGLLPMASKGQYDDVAINTAIEKLKALIGNVEEKFLFTKLKEIHDLLFSVKISMNRKD